MVRPTFWPSLGSPPSQSPHTDRKKVAKGRPQSNARVTLSIFISSLHACQKKKRKDKLKIKLNHMHKITANQKNVQKAEIKWRAVLQLPRI
uniref:MIP12489p n=1 Tax=Drosophila melanogaster TaxID=7227 RepID=C6SUS9_DROME|nr:MIP12489p [Drosophila melanogaster]